MYGRPQVSKLVLYHMAPVECALTPGEMGDSSCVIPLATAHDFTTICPFRCFAANMVFSA